MRSIVPSVRVLVIGCGNVGSEVARRLTRRGDHVVGTTTRAERLDEVRTVAADAIVLRGLDRTGVLAAGADADVIVATVSPPVAQAMTPEQRSHSYREVLVDTAVNATATGKPVVFLSSISVYGEGAGNGPVSEDTALTTIDDPAARNFIAAEDAVLVSSGGCVLRAPDIYGHPNDIDFGTRVRFAHQYMGGSVPFASEARFNRLDYRDAAEAVVHALDRGLTGAFNVVPDHAWGTNGEVFGRLAADAGLDPLEFRAEIWTPLGPIDSSLIESTGFTFRHIQEEIV